MKRTYPFENGAPRDFKIRKNGTEEEVEAQESALHDGENFRNAEKLKQTKITSYIAGGNKNSSYKSFSIVKPNEVTTTSSCFYCDAKAEIVYKCLVCLEQFCHSCSLPQYDIHGENRICTSCS